MKAIVWTKYGSADGLVLKEVPKPVPKDNQVLIKTMASTVTAGDSELRRLKFPFWLWIPLRLYMGVVNPRNIILGQELAGEIEFVGKDVKEFKPGDKIFAGTGFGFGGYADYVCLGSDGVIVLKPANMSFDEAATVPTGGMEALHFMRKGNIKAGDTLLINGAGGSIGTYALQIAKNLGAIVTCVDSTEKLEMLRSLGADELIDYTKEDFTKSGNNYDAIFDVVGKSSFAGSIKSLNPNGRYMLGNPRMLQSILGKLLSLTSNKKVISGAALQSANDLYYLKKLIEEGKVKSVIDKRFPLEKVPEAHRYVDSGEKIGNVVIVI